MTLPGEDAQLHPRPQLTRPQWTDLSGEWQFGYDDADRGLLERWERRADVFLRTIQVPFPPESRASGIGDAAPHPVVWYRRTFQARPLTGRRVHLHLGAVDYRAAVWVNGQLVATHEGGHTPFSADITSALESEGDQVVVVRAEDLPGDLTQPRGKQDWQDEPHAIWYHRTTGIWQPVWWEETGECRIGQVRWTPDVDRSSVGLEVRLVGPAPEGLQVRLRLRLGSEDIVDDVYAVQGGILRRDVAIAGADMGLGRSAHLWSPEHPHLVDARLTLTAGGEVVDEVGSYFAMRSIAVSRERLLLNGRPYFLRLALAQNYWPESHLAAPDAAALRREVELVKELGFNGVRLHQKIEDPRFLAWCDRLGVLVWAEMPSPFEFSSVGAGRVVREWLEVLDRDYSHPCVIAWVPVNESWGVPALERSADQQAFVQALYHLTKAADRTRLVIGNDGWEQLVGDLVTVHDYTASAAAMRERYGTAEAVERTLSTVQPCYRLLLLGDRRRAGEPVVISEFGGISLDAGAAKGWRGYGGVDDPGTLLAGFTGLVDALLDSPAVVGFCWTQLTDTEQERNGLLTAAREPKVDPAAVRKVLSRAPAAVPGDAVNEFAYGNYAPEGAPREREHQTGA